MERPAHRTNICPRRCSKYDAKLETRQIRAGETPTAPARDDDAVRARPASFVKLYCI